MVAFFDRQTVRIGMVVAIDPTIADLILVIDADGRLAVLYQSYTYLLLYDDQEAVTDTIWLSGPISLQRIHDARASITALIALPTIKQAIALASSGPPTAVVYQSTHGPVVRFNAPYHPPRAASGYIERYDLPLRLACEEMETLSQPLIRYLTWDDTRRRMLDRFLNTVLCTAAPSQYDAVIQCIFGGASAPRIARQRGVRPQTIRMAKHRAYRTMRTYLGDDIVGELLIKER